MRLDHSRLGELIPGREGLTITGTTLADGRVVHWTGYEGCLSSLVPLPGWRRRGEVTRYEPHAWPSH